MIPTLTDVVDVTASQVPTQPATLIGEGVMELGGHQAFASVDESFTGPCTVIADNKTVTTLPNAAEAFRAARYAISPSGGYSSAEVVLSGGREVTHSSYMEWAF